ncbi:restriction endonuclease subunit S [Enterococcus sp. AZ196]|uniref:restriction endonuclease subunit S n=1 Tax=Enterococcus sp. AZ196 TaxID=2774659 RepID=UPI003D2DF1DB
MVSKWTKEQLPNVLIDQKSAIKIGPFGSQLKKELLQKRGNYRVYGQENVYKNDFSFGDRYLSKEKFEDLKSSEICSNDIVISTMGTIGQCAIVPRNILPGIMDSHLIRLRLDNEKVDHLFLKYILQSESIQNQIKKMSVGGIMDGLSTSIIKQIEISYPSINEQKNIAATLSDIDQLINSLSELIKKKRLIKKGMTEDLLIGRKRINNLNNRWSKVVLGDVVRIHRGGSPRPIQNYLTTSSEGINWIKIGDVGSKDKYIKSTSQKITLEGVTSSRRVYKGDFLLSNSMSYGRPYILDINGAIHDGWLVLQEYNEYFDTDFLYYYLGSDIVLNQYLSKAAGSSVLNLNKELVASVEIIKPDILEQKEIARILSDMDQEVNKIEEKLEKYKKIKQGMMEQLLTGKIRLA